MDVPLGRLKLDWHMHGKKRLINNYLLGVYNAWKAKEVSKDQRTLGIEEADFNAKMRKYVNKNYKGLINGYGEEERSSSNKKSYRISFADLSN